MAVYLSKILLFQKLKYLVPALPLPPQPIAATLYLKRKDGVLRPSIETTTQSGQN